MFLLVIDLSLLSLDAADWLLDGKSGPFNLLLHQVVDYLFFAVHPLPALIWTFYIRHLVTRDQKPAEKPPVIMLIPVIAGYALLFINIFTGFVFYIGQNNVYHRGPGFHLFMVICYSYLVYALFLILRHRHTFEKNCYQPLLWLPLLPVTGGVLQAIFYGTSLIWSSLTLSLLIFYIHHEKRRLHTDYLTGVCNRMQLENILRDKIHNNHSKGKLFSGIMIDIDNFKQINDHYGHTVGDQALSTTVKLLKSCLRRDDFLARYGGDEFVILLDIKDHESLQTLVERIRGKVRSFNNSGSRPYQLSLSIGYDIYDSRSGMNGAEFIKSIDALMYRDKYNNKAR